MTEKTLSIAIIPYPRDNGRNIMGEFSHIFIISRKSDEQGVHGNQNYFLVKKVKGSNVEIDRQEFLLCCEVIVRTQAQKIMA